MTGGSCPFEAGYFVAPTVFANVEDEMTIAKEEIFGPVLTAIPYETVDEVIERANHSEFQHSQTQSVRQNILLQKDSFRRSLLLLLHLFLFEYRKERVHAVPCLREARFEYLYEVPLLGAKERDFIKILKSGLS